MSKKKFARFQVWLVQLDPTRGREVKKTRPCVIISPDETLSLGTVLVVPMTTQGFDFPFRIKCQFKSKKNLLLIDHMRAVDKSRLIKNIGTLGTTTQKKLCETLQEYFAF